MKRIYAVEIVGRVGESMTLSGWVHVRRNLGKIAFFDLRDRSGLAQIVCVPAELDADSNAVVSELRAEYCLQVEGVVQKRSGKQINPELPTGEYEVLAKKIIILNRSEVPPFEIADEDRRANEELRLKYRYLDLRHQRLQKNLELRHRVTKFFRDYLSAAGFWEIETPILTKGTPEGAREFLVPSRVHSGKFFVLPQSPQQFKQLLMVAGFEKYFQIARCFRDEDQRGDRQPEFTQLDMEMSFVEQEDIMSLVEAMLIALVKTVTPEKRIQQIPFPRIPYKEAMEKYGSDKPDIREDKNDPNLLAFCWVVDFPFFEKTEDGGWTFTHNPFSAPIPEHRELLLRKQRIGEIVATQYDIVLNGYEAGGGGIRNNTPEALRSVFEIMGMSAAEIDGQFGHMFEAFKYGTPPHGGIAPGIDRLVMILANEPNIREVIAFPKTGDARDPMMNAPSVVSAKALKEVNWGHF